MTVDHYRVVPEFVLPPFASGTLRGIVNATHAAIQANVDNLGAGTPFKGPQFVKLLREKGLIDDQNESIATTNHNDMVTTLQGIETQMETNDEGVDSSSYGAYTAAGDAYTDIDAAVKDLQGTIDDSVKKFPASVNKDTGAEFWPWSVEGPLCTACATAAAKVEQRMQQASTDIQQHARHIDYSAPGNPIPRAYGGTTAPITQAWSGTSYVPPADAGTIDKIKGFAANELGVTEQGTNHVNRPYNINDAWCASFATWVWKQSGIDVDWTNKNYVPSVWSDAAKQGLADSNMSAARPGDLVVFGGQHHIGVVVARDGNTITTIEGNSGDAVRQHTYNISGGNFAGVIHPPAKQLATTGA
ncbi:CHAP domain-containing protein [Nocardia blacklockiae]|uniref:CHAP domain-containing protein n=1 Tax=Nocardia blacklockiae TaxID=480036 RepID=UPI0018936E60|nr:CHAP domain-containing protein [Nocardia blacklockiae]MBF6174940.1 CHAP domain-containing protein [Nocardia blacklockiae]